MTAPRQHNPVTSNSHRKLIDEIERKAGVKFATVCHTKNNHLRLRLPCGRFVIAGSTPSDHRALNNIVAKIRRTQQGAPQA